MKLKYQLTNRKLSFCSLYTLKLFKVYLSSKLTILKMKNIYINLNYNKKLPYKPITKLNIYNRKNLTPLRILRYSLYFSLNKLYKLKVSKILTNKINVYNGKKLKPINIYRELLNK